LRVSAEILCNALHVAGAESEAEADSMAEAGEVVETTLDEACI